MENNAVNPYAQMDNEREIDLKQLALHVLRRWPLLLVLMLAGLIAGGAYAVVKNAAAEAALAEEEEEEEDPFEKYERLLHEYEEKKEAYELWLEKGRRVLIDSAQMSAESLPEEKTELEETYNAFLVILQMKNVEAALDALEEPEEPDEEALAEESKAEEEASAVSLPKYLMIGLFGGLFLGLFGLAVVEVLTGHVLSADEINRRYALRPLGVITTKYGKEKDLKILSAGSDRSFLRMSGTAQWDAVNANLSVYAPQVQRALLVGTVPDAQLSYVAETLGAQENAPSIAYDTAPHINENAASMQKLRDYDQVILVERVGTSVYRDVDQVIQLLYGWKKSVIGTVVLY